MQKLDWFTMSIENRLKALMVINYWENGDIK